MEIQLDKDVVCHRFYSTCAANILHRNPLKDLETSKEKVKHPQCEICRLLPEEEAMLHGITEKLIEIGRSYGKN
jgi:hypothetical protein